MTSFTGLVLLAGVSLLLWLGLVSLAVGRKLRRDRRELRSSSRRGRYEATLRGADDAALGGIFAEAGDPSARVDLAVAIDTIHPSLSPQRAAAIGRELEASALYDDLLADLKARRATTRARSVLLLTRLGIPAVVERIVPLLGDPDPDVRLVVCSGLARAATPRAAEILICGLLARALAPERIIERLGEPWAVETILQTLERGPAQLAAGCGDSLPDERWLELEASLARALGIAADPRAAPALVGLLESESVEVRISAARALGRVGGADCVPALVAALDSDPWPVRAQAAKSLGALGATVALEPLERCLSDRAWWVRTNAARALRDLGEPGIEALRRALEHDDRYAADRAREQLALHEVFVEHAAA